METSPIPAFAPAKSGWGKSGEVDVVSKACFAGTVEQPKQRDTLISAASAPDDNDDAVVGFGRCQMQKVVTVAGKQYAVSFVGKLENCLIGRIARKGLTEQCNVVTELLQQVTQLIRDVMIEQKLHSEAGAICLATSRSISPRWSS